MYNIDNIENEANRIIKAFPTKARYVGNKMIYAWKIRFIERYSQSEISEIIKSYPNIYPYQLNCLCCHTAMHLYSLAYCIAFGIKHMADGARQSQGFIVEMPEMINEYKKLYSSHGITFHTPVFDLQSDYELNLELIRYGFIPKVYEAQCSLGEPIRIPLKSENIDSLIRYYQDWIIPIIDDNLDQVVRHIKSVKAFKDLNKTE